MSGKTKVLRYESEILAVEVPDAAWCAQLAAMAPQFLARLNQFTKVKRIEFRPVGGVARANPYVKSRKV